MKFELDGPIDEGDRRRIEENQFDARYVLLWSDDGLELRDPKEEAPEHDFTPLGLVELYLREDGTVITKMATAEALGWVLPADFKPTKQQVKFFEVYMRLFNVAINEVANGVQQTARLERIFGQPIPSDFLTKTRELAASILARLKQR